MPGRKELPDTLKRSPRGAQDTWVKAHDSAVDTYGEGERAHRVAFAALKHGYEKVGDRWEPKEGKGPSDKQAANPKAPKQRAGSDKPTAGGVDANASKEHLYRRAKELGVRGRSQMSKKELVDALQKESRSRTRKARAS
ncbi:ChaB family protein [Streptomonospora nanhaiensis]|uniref:Cation transport regulator ChaB n=1 Tax=Streptomonospora nanhaiensis TaxID=1323731 RepID=A0A853BFK9_9ACTN|nr:ChaB family protein [Streptomonospora nanhaiensis]MBV2364445.1 ChaB family protein [Streptomonospora nanhaiensis]MBX9387887.1 ChaB family protein [Streptomonospora nanhaiensis]NYI94079.1 cation transport regulator ChaB [Streptomonospora nanhaiensis]